MITVHVTCIIITECAKNTLKTTKGNQLMKLLGKRKKRKIIFTNIQLNESLDTLPEIPLHPELNKNIEILKSAYKDCSDVVFREFSIGSRLMRFFFT